MGNRSESTRRTGVVAAVVACLVVLTTVVAPAMVSARPANQIPVESVSAGDQPQQPTGEAWDTVPAVGVPMASAPSGLPNASDTSVETLRVQSARTDERLYLRLSWADGTADRNASAPREFADAAAVQVPVNTSARPPISMGSTRNLVNVWYWQAGGETEELLAGGPGTTTSFEGSAVDTSTHYDDGRWTVVMSRDIAANAENRTTFAVDNDVDVAFAVWNGSHMERSGRKSVSEWYHFPLGPGPQGPPYESILWAVAGLAIVGVTLVTAQAVRKN
ncbi:complex iron-sulfur molybdoenzyme family reductase subunit gamma [Halogranum gelatinilyticum]|uniref:Complex iron-sulfur molybdoenzyme family reductase subunit gamma n=1 Tax=Halogranum gelatinilyticum TaxID=660521 RepID=A0A1G9YLI9_9EURY|nr:ethylbenzene dehydrogenase-related protein [Halogranum gelatinilyticum]SDN10089.1 complex iron-sulfur molybdoenzyme family reductase subunit gamma [Halogranum gelatinilyticum]